MNTIALRNRVIAVAATIAAAFIGWDVAEGDFLLLGLVAAFLLLAIFSYVSRQRADGFFAGIVLFGYLTGNRGFAQLHMPNLPLLPAEAILLLGGAMLFWHSAQTKTLPVRRDLLNGAIILWIIVAAARLPQDFHTFGFVAVRDFAMVYYALFFFLGQSWATDTRARHWIRWCLVVGFALCAPFFGAFETWPDFFIGRLTVGGVPLVFVKSDVVGGFMAAGAVWFAFNFSRSRRWPWLVCSLIATTGMVLCNSRAALVGFAIVLVWLVVLRQWATLRTLGVFAALGVLALVVQATVSRTPFVQTPLYRAYESVASIGDWSGTRTYHIESLSDKPDNNQFRLVWWHAVVDQTTREGPWLGVGFGRDIAEEFLQLYYADTTEDFSARSPHNFLLSIFARMGTVGAAIFMLVIVAMARNTWRAAKQDDPATANESVLPYWLSCWAILVSACFGVVLEGPMGAVIFWTMLGLATGKAFDGNSKSEQARSAAGKQVASLASHPAV
jgi:O-antigen ligase